MLLPLASHSAAAVIGRLLKALGVNRVFGFCDGHVKPIWICLNAEGIAIVDVRVERAAVYMAHTHDEIRGRPSVAPQTHRGALWIWTISECCVALRDSHGLASWDESERRWLAASPSE